MMKINDVRDRLPTHKTKTYPIRNISDITHIAVHHSLTDNIPGGRDVYVFARYHIENNDWPGIGYHYVIDKDGTVYKTNSAEIKSYHVGKHNKYSLGVCLVGDFRNYNPKKEQYNALIELLNKIRQAYDIDIDNILGHSEFEGYEWKKCPAINMTHIREVLKGNIPAEKR